MVMQSGQPLIVADTAQDETCVQHPLITGNGVRFYARVPLIAQGGHVIGTLCLLDSAPHASLTPAEQQTLTDLAALVMDELERRRLAVTSERQSSAHELLSDDLHEALAQSETLQAISELSDLNLSLDDLLLRAVALYASVCDVDLGSLVALHRDRAFILPAWHSQRAEQLAALVSRGLRRSECQDLWSAALSGGGPQSLSTITALSVALTWPRHRSESGRRRTCWRGSAAGCSLWWCSAAWTATGPGGPSSGS